MQWLKEAEEEEELCFPKPGRGGGAVLPPASLSVCMYIVFHFVRIFLSLLFIFSLLFGFSLSCVPPFAIYHRIFTGLFLSSPFFVFLTVSPVLNVIPTAFESHSGFQSAIFEGA